MKYILPYLRPYRRQTALAMVLVAFATVCDLLLPTIMNDILNHGVRQSDFAYIVRCCVWMLAVAAAGLAALLAGRKISCDVVAGFNADHHDLDGLPLGQIVVDIADVSVRDLGNVDKAGGRRVQRDKCAEFRQALDGPFNNFSYL